MPLTLAAGFQGQRTVYPRQNPRHICRQVIRQIVAIAIVFLKLIKNIGELYAQLRSRNSQVLDIAMFSDIWIYCGMFCFTVTVEIGVATRFNSTTRLLIALTIITILLPEKHFRFVSVLWGVKAIPLIAGRVVPGAEGVGSIAIGGVVIHHEGIRIHLRDAQIPIGIPIKSHTVQLTI